MDADARRGWAGSYEPSWTMTVVRPDVTPADPAVVADLDDHGLVQECLAGHRHAFDVIVERHRKSVYQVCYRFVSNHEDASDLAQDVFVRAFRGLKTFKGQSSLSTWLYRIAVNLCLNRVSAKKVPHEPIDAHQHVDTASESPADRVIREERAIRVRTAVAQLPPKQRAALVLRVFHDLSHQQIAEVLDTSVGAVKANFFHALANLKKILGDRP